MFTLFAMPKEFKGHNGIIQRNAIRSWKEVVPDAEIILFGEETGIKEIAAELGLRHIPYVERNEHGTPLISYLFHKAQEESTRDWVCYINSDIILTNEFVRTYRKARERFSKCMMVGRRWDMDIKDTMGFADGWEKELKVKLKTEGKLHAYTGIDYFLFYKGLYDNVPPFAIGRTVWDQWLIYYPFSKNVPVVDASEGCIVIHQNHDFSHHPQGYEGLWNGEEAKRNFKLSGGYENLFTIRDCKYVIGKDGIRKRKDITYFLYRWLISYSVLNKYFIRVKPLVEASLHRLEKLLVFFGKTIENDNYYLQQFKRNKL